MKKTRQLACMALLAAIALTIYVVEAQIPVPIPVPGVKLGLANAVTLLALFTLGPWQALAILLVRIVLGSMFTGQLTALLYSLCGGLLCWAVTCLLRRIVTDRQLWVCGVTGAMAHNTGQILMAMVVTGTPSIAVYLPFLLVTGIVTGLFTGLAAQAVCLRLRGRLK